MRHTLSLKYSKTCLRFWRQRTLYAVPSYFHKDYAYKSTRKTWLHLSVHLVGSRTFDAGMLAAVDSDHNNVPRARESEKRQSDCSGMMAEWAANANRHSLRMKRRQERIHSIVSWMTPAERKNTGITQPQRCHHHA